MKQSVFLAVRAGRRSGSEDEESEMVALEVWLGGRPAGSPLQRELREGPVGGPPQAPNCESTKIPVKASARIKPQEPQAHKSQKHFKP